MIASSKNWIGHAINDTKLHVVKKKQMERSSEPKLVFQSNLFRDH